MLSARLPLTDLVDLCRVLRHNLGAGLTIQRVMQQQSERGRRSFRTSAGRLNLRLQQGSSLTDALGYERGVFPPLFLSMVKLGETTGHLAEIFGELENYYQLELQLRREFRSQTFLPIAQFVFAVLVIALVIFILGVINPDRPLLTIFGLGGAAGATAFLGAVGGTLITVWLFYYIASRLGRQKAWMDRLLLGLPALGSCLRSLVMSRFTLALQLTLDTGLPIAKALRLSLEATGNAHFAAHADAIALALKNGQTLHEALDASWLFTSEFMEMVVSAEASGRVPEMMRVLAKQYQEETSRKMKLLTRSAAGLVWLCVAGFIIWGIFSLASIYLNALAGKF